MEGDVTSDLQVTHKVKIDATKPEYYGVRVAYVSLPSRRPTGLYVPAGQVARVQVPSALVGKGANILVGAHTRTQAGDAAGTTRPHKRAIRAATRYPVLSEVTEVTNPLGGGLYIEVPYLMDEGLVEIEVSGVVKAPFTRC